MRKIMITLLLVLILGLSGLTQAQSMMEIPCGDLAEADCEILQQSQHASMEVSSYNFQMAVDLTMENLPEVPEPLVINLSGTGTFSGDMTDLMALQSDAMTMMSDPEAYAEFVGTALGAMDMDFDFVLTLPDFLVEQGGGQVPGSIPLQIRLVDGAAYMNFDALADALGEEMSQGMPPGWMGIDLIGLMDATMAQGDMEAFGAGMESSMAMQSQMMQRMSDPEFVAQYLHIERLADVTAADGDPAAVFSMTLDYAGLMSDPEVQTMMSDMMASAGEKLSEEEMASALQMMSQMFEGLNLNILQTVDVNELLPESTEVTFSWDMTSLSTMMAEEDPSSDMPPMIITLHALISYSDWNAAPEVTVPENATLIPLESLGLGEMAEPE